ncbi:glycosyltransferase family A protein [Flavobacterium sp. TMP13]|uniref:glycosyltransferase family A protein n=1 Tax=Flavobacterium sp. TMP13 TaxID=3425950 RepID=UPI003D77B946
MRVGSNPQKDKKIESSDYFHQVIVPVYIPNQEGYFKDGLAILQYCLESLVKTSHNKTFISIINNGSCDVVSEYLERLRNAGTIQELIHTSNIGKMNAVLKGIVGHSFDLVTVADADVLFLEDWQTSSYKVFEAFPKAGMVCTTPSSRSYKVLTSNIYWDYLFSKKLAFRSVKNPEALKAFAHSVGNESFYNQEHLNNYLTIKENNVTAVVGAGHFVATYRGGIFESGVMRNSLYKMGGTSESDLLDVPVVKKDFWRLSTEDNYTYHMGNVLEDWMKTILEHQSKLPNTTLISCPEFSFYGNSKIVYWFKSKLFGKIIFDKPVLKWVFRIKGLSKETADFYIKG